MSDDYFESLEQSIEESLFDERESSLAEESKTEEPSTNEYGDYSNWRDWILKWAEEQSDVTKEADVPAEPERALNSVNLEEYQIYKLSNNMYAVFGKDIPVQLIDGKLINMGTSNITGLYISSLTINPNQPTDTITILPYTSSGSIGRNGSNTYYTDYSTSGGNWYSTNYYINVTAEDQSKAGYSVTGIQWAILVLLFVILFVVAFRNIFKS